MLRLSVLALTLAPGLPALAQDDDAAALYDALRLDDVIAMMREEGLEYGRDLEEELFPGKGGPAWEARVAAIYDIDEMQDRIARDFAGELEGTDLAPLLDFFTSEPGREIVALEIEARRALRNEVVEEAAEARAIAMREANDPRMDQIDSFVEANDLVEENVVGALNSNYAFYQGLIEGGAFGGEISEDQILADVWAQEPGIRADTLQWIYGYLALAYQPLDDEELEAYVALSRTEEGEALNDALFAAFDDLYVDISRELGQRAAGFMLGTDI